MKILEVSDETYDRIKDQLKEDEKEEINDLNDFVGKKLFLRTVTYHIVGKVEKIIKTRSGESLQLSTASWVADSGRFMQAIKDGILNEIEPLGEWFVNFNTVTDYGIWNHALPTKQK